MEDLSYPPYGGLYTVNVLPALETTGGTLVMVGSFQAWGSFLQSGDDGPYGGAMYLSFGVEDINSRFAPSLNHLWCLIMIIASPTSNITTLRVIQNNVHRIFTKPFSPNYFRTANFGWTSHNAQYGAGGALGEGRIYNYPLPVAGQDALIADLRTKWAI